MTAPAERHGVLCAGSILVDAGKVIDAYPPVDGLALVESITLSTGGAAINMATDLARLAAPFPVALLGVVGDDAHGAFVREECARLGIDASAVRTVPDAVTAFTDVMVERVGGRRTFFHHVGVNARFHAGADDLARTGARILHVGVPGVLPRMDAPVAGAGAGGGGNGWSALLAAAQARGIHTNLEMAGLAPEVNRALAGPCLPHLDSLIVNELEAGALAGIDAPAVDPDGPVAWERLEAMARALLDRGVRQLVVIHVPAGAVAAAPDGRTWRQGSVRVPREAVRSATGAGDAIAAGVLLGLHEGWPVEDCLRLGVAAAAACVRSPHTSEGIPDAGACLAAADHDGYRPTG
ncbi:MAG: carbohydrate kinase family protein [Chloroflexota bacterium]